MSKPRKTIIGGRKYCTLCWEWVKVEKFGYREHTYDNLSNWCKPCLAEYAACNRLFSPKYKEWYKRYYTPEKMKEKYQAQKALWERRKQGNG